MANRKGVFIGAYVPNDLKESLRRKAAAEHRTLSQEITRILTGEEIRRTAGRVHEHGSALEERADPCTCRCGQIDSTGGLKRQLRGVVRAQIDVRCGERSENV